MRSYANHCAKIFNREIKLKSNSLRKIGKIKRRTLRNIKQINKKRKYLKKSMRLLNTIQCRTLIMYKRVRALCHDDLLRENDSDSSLTAGKLLVLLEFLTERYDLEWEAMEMVIRK